MRVWYTQGAHGSTVLEIGWKDLWRLLTGQDIKVDGTGVTLSFGKASCTARGGAPSREEQLARRENR